MLEAKAEAIVKILCSAPLRPRRLNIFLMISFLRVKEEEQDLSEAFKRRLGLVSGVEHDPCCAGEMLDETMRDLGEISLPSESRDVEREATLTRAKFDKFVKTFFQSKSSQVYAKIPLTEPLLAKKQDLDRTV